MSKKNLLIIVAGLIAVIVGVIMIWPVTENARIEKNLYKLIGLIEGKKATAVVEMLAENFSAPGFNRREEILQTLRGFFFQTRDLEIKVNYLKHENDKISRDAEEARLLVVAVVSGETSGQKFQGFGKGGVDTVLITFKKQQGEWLPASARYIDVADPAAALDSIFKAP